MFLVDTSVWIDFLRGRSTNAVETLESILDRGLAYGITEVIYQEVLQGASSSRDFKKLSEYFSTLRLFQPLDGIKTYDKAAKLYFDCRKEGVTIRSTIDCLIAQIAIEHKLTLLHSDKDYERIAQFAPLKLA